MKVNSQIGVQIHFENRSIFGKSLVPTVVTTFKRHNLFGCTFDSSNN